MQILVCMKAVPTAAQAEVDGQFRLQRNSMQLQWNIADESALEAAARLKGIDGTVTVLTMGPAKLAPALQELLARGADRAVLLTDPTLAGADTLATARALAAAAGYLGGFDLILCGRRAIDGETGQVPGMLAGALDIPCITNAEALESAPEGLTVLRRLEDSSRRLAVSLPAVVTLCEYAYPLALPGILALRQARQKQVQLLDADTLGIAPQQRGLKGSPTRVVSMSTRFPGLRKGPKTSNADEGAAHIARMFREVGL